MSTINPIGTSSPVPYSGNRVLIQKQVVSAQSTVNFTGFLNSIYLYYEFDLYNITKSSANTLGMRTSTDGGANYATSGYNSSFVVYDSSTVTSTNGGTNGSFVIIPTSGTTLSVSSAYRVYITTDYVQTMGQTTAVQGSNTTWLFSGYINSTGVNALRFLATAGTMTGTFSLYGVLA